MSNSEFITIIFKIICMILSIVITYFVIPFIKEVTDKYKDAKLEKCIRDSVTAAEQIIKGDKKGAEKKARVLNAVTAWLNTHNITMTADEIDDMIESMVFMMNHPEVFTK